jgi:predicted nucleic acid-binding protein
MATRAFVDTGAFYAMLDRSDSHHRDGVAAFGRLAEDEGQGITTSLVVAETFALLQRKLTQTVALRWLGTLERASIRVVWPPEEIAAEAGRVLRRFADQDFSFTDAVSFGLMRREGVRAYISFDHHFDVFGRTHGWSRV